MYAARWVPHATAWLACCLFWAPAFAADVQVAVAANFAGPLAKIGESFTAATGHKLLVSPGPTGKFYTQIAQGGAPFEVLIAADDETPKRLISEGFAVAGSNFTYAIGQLVLWSAQPGLVDDQGAVLAAGKFNKLAIANPKIAPYGAAGIEVLKARGLLDAVTPKLVTGDSIAQAYQFVSSGNADVGFVALSQVIGAGPPQANDAPLGGRTPRAAQGSNALPGKPMTGSMWKVPQSLYGQIRQDAVLLKAGQDNPAAKALLDYLKSAPAKAVIASYGYQ
ncbi:MAG: molybdate ABC transporter substrate-binding protein [Burkholderiales bacterium]